MFSHQISTRKNVTYHRSFEVCLPIDLSGPSDPGIDYHVNQLDQVPNSQSVQYEVRNNLVLLIFSSTDP